MKTIKLKNGSIRKLPDAYANVLIRNKGAIDVKELEAEKQRIAKEKAKIKKQKEMKKKKQQKGKKEDKTKKQTKENKQIKERVTK